MRAIRKDFLDSLVESFLIDPGPCGCCGRAAVSGRDWCADCAGHVAPEGPPPWHRTYHAQHGVNCPHQVDQTGIDLP